MGLMQMSEPGPRARRGWAEKSARLRGWLEDKKKIKQGGDLDVPLGSLFQALDQSVELKLRFQGKI